MLILWTFVWGPQNSNPNQFWPVWKGQGVQEANLFLSDCTISRDGDERSVFKNFLAPCNFLGLRSGSEGRAWVPHPHSGALQSVSPTDINTGKKLAQQLKKIKIFWFQFLSSIFLKNSTSPKLCKVRRVPHPQPKCSFKKPALVFVTFYFARNQIDLFQELKRVNMKNARN